MRAPAEPPARVARIISHTETAMPRARTTGPVPLGRAAEPISQAAPPARASTADPGTSTCLRTYRPISADRGHRRYRPDRRTRREAGHLRGRRWSRGCGEGGAHVQPISDGDLEPEG